MNKQWRCSNCHRQQQQQSNAKAQRQNWRRIMHQESANTQTSRCCSQEQKQHRKMQNMLASKWNYGRWMCAADRRTWSACKWINNNNNELTHFKHKIYTNDYGSNSVQTVFKHNKQQTSKKPTQHSIKMHTEKLHTAKQKSKNSERTYSLGRWRVGGRPECCVSCPSSSAHSPSALHIHSQKGTRTANTWRTAKNKGWTQTHTHTHKPAAPVR